MNVLELLAAFGIGFVVGAGAVAVIWWQHVSLLNDTMNTIHNTYRKEIDSVHGYYQDLLNKANAKVATVGQDVKNTVDKAVGN